MSIQPDSIYDSLRFYRHEDDKTFWTMNGPLSGDLLAGIITGLKIVLDVVPENTDDCRIQIDRVGKILTYNWTNIYPDFFIALNEYRTLAKIKNPFIGKYFPDPEHYGWFMKNKPNANPDYEDIEYDLYEFETPEFIQGFISMCNAGQVDFRDYVYGTPFIYDFDAREYIKYAIEGYDIEDINIIPRIPAPIGAFYTGGFEDDDYGVDWE